MSYTINRVAVIGAGIMGSGIAAHIANANFSVHLLDIPQKGWGKKNALAENAIEMLLKADPAPFISSKAAENIIPGNIEDDLEKIKDCDWVIEVIVEKLDLKRELYQKIESFLKPSTLISSNTSTIPLHQLVEGRSETFKKNFFITHFFNPPRYMRLLEIVKGPDASPEAFQTLYDFCEIRLGKGVVTCHDTPGFIGNRIGTFWLQTALLSALDMNITIEQADAVFSRPMGIPKTGVFGLIDLVGVDLIPLIQKSMRASLPADDPFCQNREEIPLLKTMIAEGYTGRKGKGGFYRLKTENGTKIKESIDLHSGQYRVSIPIKHPLLEGSRPSLKTFLMASDPLSQYGWKVLSEVLSYAVSLVPAISLDIVGIDAAMKWGYNWKFGPFELLDQLGPVWFSDRLKKEGRALPPLLEKVIEVKGTFYREYEGNLQYFTLHGTYEKISRRAGQLFLSDIKRKTKVLLNNSSANLWDIGDGVACLEFQSKMNTIDPDIMAMIRQSIEYVQNNLKALVIYNEGTHFSAGANISHALFAANVGSWALIFKMVSEGQETYKALKYAPFPVVSAPSGLAIGGGCEILLHSDAIQAHMESYIGLVEVGVGLVPSWGGCKEMTNRWLHHQKQFGGTVAAVAKVFEIIGTAKVSKSAAEAKEMLFLHSEDKITMNRDRLLMDAKEKALALVPHYLPPAPFEFHLPGSTARIALSMAVKALILAGKASSYDEEITKKLAFILTGGDTDITDTITEEQMYQLEIEAFMSLVKNPKTLARMEHMLETGKPLRN